MSGEDLPMPHLPSTSKYVETVEIGGRPVEHWLEDLGDERVSMPNCMPLPYLSARVWVGRGTVPLRGAAGDGAVVPITHANFQTV